MVREVGASAGILFLLEPGACVLHMALVSGVSRRVFAPWTRIPADAASPVAEAIRRDRLVWVSSQEEMARRYPRIGLVAPYEFLLAAAPIASGSTPWGGMVLLWPVSHAPELSGAEREAIDASCCVAARRLRAAADSGTPLKARAGPLVLPAPETSDAGSAQGRAALRYTRRLRTGCCSLDLDGQIEYLNDAGADMLGVSAASPLGRRPWEAFLWLQSSAFESRYRAAVFSRQPTSFTAVRPSGGSSQDREGLRFTLYPDASGISVHIASADAPAEDAATGLFGWTVGPVGVTMLAHLTHLAAALSETPHVRDVVDLAVDQIVPAFGVDAAEIATVQEGRLRLAGYRGFSAEAAARLDGTPLTAAQWPAVRALAFGKTAFFSTPEELVLSSPTEQPPDGMAAWAFLPLIASGHPIGVLDIAYRPPHSFSSAERAILSSLAGVVAQALDRASLYDEQHSLAHSLQRGLLPSALPQVPGLRVAGRYRSAGAGVDVGGDFYDLIRCSPTTAVAVVGDVQGHNSAAAAVMGQVRTAIHAFATVGSAPGDLLHSANRLLAEFDTTLFASCLIIELDLAAHRGIVSSAGHPPALLRHPTGRTETLAPAAGLLLGIEAEAEYPALEFSFPADAVLGLYTDGLVECPGVDIDDATAALAHRLARTTPDNLEGMADVLVRHAQRTTPSSDDLALLLLRLSP
ncbi:SpoIIE family protein phosphatase [Streptomyces sp. NPDC005803]|uniref:SpoIIE family protein phosphatase n=1 Tax=Streptomyces sp. NPDC005803 TaxID=3154297 RepID=UPI0033E7AE21